MEKRLEILLNGQVINQSIYEGMIKVISALEREFEVSIRTSQAEMALTHMASAMMRSYKGECIEPISDDILEEVISSEYFEELKSIHKKLLSFFTFDVSPNEEGYLLCNLYSLKYVTE